VANARIFYVDDDIIGTTRAALDCERHNASKRLGLEEKWELETKVGQEANIIDFNKVLHLSRNEGNLRAAFRMDKKCSRLLQLVLQRDEATSETDSI
jgi:hypothetical protein